MTIDMQHFFSINLCKCFEFHRITSRTFLRNHITSLGSYYERTSLWATHEVPGGFLVPMGTMLETLGLVNRKLEVYEVDSFVV